MDRFARVATTRPSFPGQSYGAANTRIYSQNTRQSQRCLCVLFHYPLRRAVLSRAYTVSHLGMSWTPKSWPLGQSLGCRRCPPPRRQSPRGSLCPRDPVAWHAQIYLPRHAWRVTAFSTERVPKSVACRLPWIAMSRTRSAKDLRIQPPASSRSGVRNSAVPLGWG